MNLLVTGGCGFIGSNFVNFIFSMRTELGITNLINLDAMYYCADENYIDSSIREHPNYFLVKGNTGNKDLIENVLNFHKITHVINFAAQSHVCNSFSNPIQYTHDNIFGTHILLDCCYKYHNRTNNISRFIQISMTPSGRIWYRTIFTPIYFHII